MKENTRSYTSYLVVLFLFLASATVLSAQSQSKFRMFSDKKNGYFRMLVPATWRQQDYEDSRTKVAFYHPTEKDVYIRIWAREAEVDYDYPTLLKEKKEWARTATAEGLPSTVSEENIGIFHAIVISTTVPNMGNIEQVFFLQSGIHFHLSLGASSKQRIEKYHQLYRQTVESINAVARSTHDPEKAKAQLLSWYVRFAELQIQLGNHALAREIAKEGLVEFPGSQRLKELAQGKGRQ